MNRIISPGPIPTDLRKFPEVNLGIIINGFLFRVIRSDRKRGKVNLKLVKPVQDKSKIIKLGSTDDES